MNSSSKTDVVAVMNHSLIRCICVSWEDKYNFIRIHDYMILFITQAKGHLAKRGDLSEVSWLLQNLTWKHVAILGMY